MNSWKLGVKGITLYRDGSKIAQPLNQRLDEEDTSIDLENLTYTALLEYARKVKARLLEQEKEAGPPRLSRRDKPLGIRSGHTHPAQIEDVKIYTTVNRASNGEISEIYITTDREGTLIMGLLNSLSKTISVMLQYHIPPQNISKMLRGQKYEPYGFVTRHPYIKYCTSVSDLISKIIDIEIGDYSRCQVKPDTTDEEITNGEAAAVNHAGEAPDAAEANLVFPRVRLPEYATGSQAEPAIEGLAAAGETATAHENDDEQVSLYDINPGLGADSGYIHEKARDAAINGERLYDGSICPNCSSTRMVRNGTCKICLDCGTTTGCS